MPKTATPPNPPVGPPEPEGARLLSPEAPAPQTLADIPGLGPIRIRALQKAGLNSLALLRSATLDTLLAVPGLSEIKARHIQTYLGQFPTEAFKRKIPDPEKPRKVGVKNSEARDPALLVQWEATPADARSTPTSPLAAEAARMLSRIVTLLLSPHAPEFRNRLLRAAEQLARRCENLILLSAPYTATDQERAMRRLRRISETVAAVSAHTEFDRKEQARLAENITELCDWLDATSSAKATGGGHA